MKLIQAKTRFQRWLLLGLGVVSILTVFVGLPAQAFALTNKPDIRVCPQEYAYVPTLVNKKYLHQTASPLAAINSSSSNVVLHKTVTITGTTNYSGSLTLTAGGEANAGVLFASVKTTFSASVTGTISKSYSRSETDAVDVPVPAHSTRHIAYGRLEIVTRGEYEVIRENCSVVNEGTVTVYFPYGNAFVITN
jgi:hypothetical protein